MGISLLWKRGDWHADLSRNKLWFNTGPVLNTFGYGNIFECWCLGSFLAGQLYWRSQLSLILLVLGNP